MVLRKIRLAVEPFFIVAGKLLYCLFPYRVYNLFLLLKAQIHTSWIRNVFNQCGKGSLIYPHVEIKGGDYISIGTNTVIKSHSFITAWKLIPKKTPNLSVGSNCDFGEYTHVSCANSIVIGDSVLFGKNVTVVDNSHGSLNMEQIEMSPLNRPIESKGQVYISDNVWVGDKVTILPSVTIGRGAIIASNAVVTSDIPEYCVAAGIPAKIVKRLTDTDKQ